ncbi:MAG: hypothetical protein JWO33_759 [Caulobacteraceae bacterium]|nr:hypothetical protein [Caulobacteraceae bacterium]
MAITRNAMLIPLMLVLTGAATAPASAQIPADLGDLVGARGSSGETQMQARGYDFIKTVTVRDEKWSYWWSGSQGRCVQVATADGRYAAINSVPPLNCGKSPADAGGGPRDQGHQAFGGDGSRPITLICYGEGRKPSVESRQGYEWNNQTRKFEPTYRVQSGSQAFDSEVQVEVRGSRGRIHLTGKLVAPIHSGDVDGWWELKDLSVDRDRITGQYRLNGLNSPKVVIDRRSGRIRIDGIEHFRGECDAGDWDSDRRF